MGRLGSVSRLVGRLGSGLRVNTSFQIFSRGLISAMKYHHGFISSIDSVKGLDNPLGFNPQILLFISLFLCVAPTSCTKFDNNNSPSTKFKRETYIWLSFANPNFTHHFNFRVKTAVNLLNVICTFRKNSHAYTVSFINFRHFRVI